MSGQMSNGEIEGVLASIRRLLRDDATDQGPEAAGDPGTGPMDVWPGAVPPDARGATPARPARKLVLNPDAMVRKEGAMATPGPAGMGAPLVLTDPALVPEPEGAAPVGADLTDDPRVAAWSTPLLLSDPVVLPGDGARRPWPGSPPDAGSVVRAADPAQDGEGGVPVPDPAPEVVWRPVARAAAPGAPTRRPPSLEERIAELEAALARDEETLEPDGGDPAPAAALAGSSAAAPNGAGPAPREGSGLQPRLGPAEVRAWIAAESLKAFGTLPEEIAGEIAGGMAAAGPDAAVEGTGGPGDDGDRPEDFLGSADGPGSDIGAIVADAGEGGDIGGTGGLGADDHPQEAPAAAASGPVAVFHAVPDGDMPDGAMPEGAGPDHGPANLTPADHAPANLTPANLTPADHAPAGPAPLDMVPHDTASPDTASLNTAVADAGQPPTGPAADHGLDPAMAAAVRALVSDTIRAELRGPLGEDLTRSIRRLVRREWARLSAPND